MATAVGPGPRQAMATGDPSLPVGTNMVPFAIVRVREGENRSP